ncbi:MAG: hypothetical protein HC804_03235 [Anaerolineae bacterium]|nr:hypothetical protein [Anaerolineae bacterium]
MQLIGFWWPICFTKVIAQPGDIVRQEKRLLPGFVKDFAKRRKARANQEKQKAVQPFGCTAVTMSD